MIIGIDERIKNEIIKTRLACLKRWNRCKQFKDLLDPKDPGSKDLKERFLVRILDNKFHRPSWSVLHFDSLGKPLKVPYRTQICQA